MFEVFKGADEVDHAGNAEMLGGAGAGLDGHGAERRGTTLGKDNAVHAGAICDAEQGTKILRVFHTIKGKDEAGLLRPAGSGRGALEKVFNGEELLGAHQGDDTLMGSGTGELGELLTGLLADAHTGLPAVRDQAGNAVVMALAGHKDVVKSAPASPERLLDWMQTVENFHKKQCRRWAVKAGLTFDSGGKGQNFENQCGLGRHFVV